MLKKRICESGLESQLDAESAGAFPGVQSRGAERKTVELAAKHGLDLTHHRTRECVAADLERFDRCVVLDDESYIHAQRLAADGRSATPIDRFVDYFGDLSLLNVADPVLGNIGYEEAFRILDRGTEILFERLKRQLP